MRGDKYSITTELLTKRMRLGAEQWTGVQYAAHFELEFAWIVLSFTQIKGALAIST